MITPQDESFLRRAMRLAMNGRGHTEPNPSVGCVLVKNGQTIGEGWTQPFGGAHAEPTALAHCKANGNDPAGATAYVTLEPCCHTNKKTPPCAPRLIAAKIARVVIGCLDPNPDVNGNGVAMLRAAGIEVDILPGAKSYALSPVPGGEGGGEGENARGLQATSRPPATTPSPQPSPPGTRERELNGSHFQQLIAPFTLRQHHRRPFVTTKWAQTADGKIGLPGGKPLPISNAMSNRIIHQFRGRCDAIVVGARTALSDDPMLSVRGTIAARTPVRCVLDPSLDLPITHRLATTAGQIPTICYCDELLARDKARVAALKAFDVEIVFVSRPEHAKGRHLDLRAVAADWFERGFSHVLVEAGARLAHSMVNHFADRVWTFDSAVELNERHAPAAPRFLEDSGFVVVGTLNLAGDTLTEYLNTTSPAFFAAVPSADFVLAAEEAGASVA